MMSSQVSREEIEIKVRLDSFTDYLKLLGYLGQIESEIHQLNGFFDSESRSLAKAGWALRVRAENQRGLVTAKSIPTQAGMAIVRQEIEAEISRSEALEVLHLHKDLLSLDVMPVAFLKGKIPNLTLARLISFQNIRQRKLLKIGESSYLLEVDKTEYSDGSVDYELEVELHDTDTVELVENHLHKLFDSLGIPFERQSESKLARALRRARIL